MAKAAKTTEETLKELEKETEEILKDATLEECDEIIAETEAKIAVYQKRIAAADELGLRLFAEKNSRWAKRLAESNQSKRGRKSGSGSSDAKHKATVEDLQAALKANGLAKAKTITEDQAKTLAATIKKTDPNAKVNKTGVKSLFASTQIPTILKK